METHDDFLDLLRETFRDEADEHLTAMRSGLLQLEGDMEDEERFKLITTIYRAAHSLKGASRAVDVPEVETLCQALESLFQAMQKGKLLLSPAIFDAVHKTLDAVDKVLADPCGERTNLVSDCVLALRAMTQSPREEKPARVFCQDPPSPPLRLDEGDTAREAPGAAPFAELSPPPEPVPSHTEAPPSPEPRVRAATIRIPAERLDKVLFQAEEMLSVKLSLSRQVAELKASRERGSELESAWSRIAPVFDRVISAVKADNPVDANAIDEFIAWQRGSLKRGFLEQDALVRSAENDSRIISTMVDDLLDDTKRLLLMPMSSISGGFPKMVRDLSRDLGKDVELRMSGDDVELEKRILERLKDPLIHLLRNAVDHGIESPEERNLRGKAPKGTIGLSVSRLGGDRVELVLSDDGAGVDPARLRNALVEAGQFEPEAAAALEGESLVSMIFRPGVSTSGKVTEISGRGLGMSIVQEAVEGLGGTIGIESRAGAGMTVRMMVPVTKATFRGVLVRISGRLFVIPTAAVWLVSRAGIAEVGKAESRKIIRLDGVPCGLVHLADILGIGRALSSDGDEKIRFVAMEAAGIRVAFLVDEVVDELEVLVKPLGPRLRGLKYISGLAILGTGELVPILDGRNLVLGATRGGAASRPAPEANPPSAAGTGGGARSGNRAGPHSILVVEDSITSRLLLKNILEAAGYSVSTAVDGQEGFTALKTGRFDLVVSDVEMPRMDGFRLTEKIRADEAVSKTPVVLVTSLESREHRERGVDAGADAYIVKSGFEQGVLLDTIHRLL